MAYEDFLADYAEQDEDTNVTVAQNKVSWVDMGRTENAHLSDSKGAGHFSGDFTHLLEMQASNADGYSVALHWILAQSADNYKVIYDASGDMLAIDFEGNSNETINILVVENGAVYDSDGWGSAVAGTTYYVTVDRDDDAGSNSKGLMTITIRITSHAGAVQDTLTADCNEQNDFEYVFGMSSYDDDGGTETDGFTENLDLQEAAPPAAEGQVITIQMSKMLLPALWACQGKGSRRQFVKNTLAALLGMK